MDPITHGIAGALLGKAFFSRRHGRIATFAATLGAVFPDVDVFVEAAARDPLGIMKYHRGFTHSFLGLPLFASVLALLTRAACRARNKEAPSWLVLSVIYGVGIASHILFDGMTSFGTRMWSPLTSTRVAWDLIFIIDFTFTAIVFVPQVAAWIYKDSYGTKRRATAMWVLFSLAAAGVWQFTQSLGIGFSPWGLAKIIAVPGAVFLLPLWDEWGNRIGREAWCRAGVWVLALYLLACGAAHHEALRRVQEFARLEHVAPQSLAALPLPPSLLMWNGLIRTGSGVYEARIDVRHAESTEFVFVADSPHDAEYARAQELPGVKLYLWFARFPVSHETSQGDETFLDFRDVRFEYPGRPSPIGFTYRVVFDAQGQPVREGWAQPQRRLPSRKRQENAVESDP